MSRIQFGLCGAVAFTCFAAAVLWAAPVDDGLKIPNFDHWYLVNSMLVTKETPRSAAAGLHLIYINERGLERLKTGGAAPYPDGTMFVDDVRDTSEVDGAYLQGSRKVVPLMVKDAKKYALTGGWGFQAYGGGDPQKPIVTDAEKQCFACHAPEKMRDSTFSTYLR
jgi:hypothetical protein